MGDREDKLAKAREKLEKFRKNKPKKDLPAALPEIPQGSHAQEAQQTNLEKNFCTTDSQEGNVASYFPTTQGPDGAGTESGAGGAGGLSSYFSAPSGESSAGGISDAFASIVSTLNVGEKIVSTLQELVVEEPEEEGREQVFEVEEEEVKEVVTSAVPGPAFYIGGQEEEDRRMVQSSMASSSSSSMTNISTVVQSLPATGPSFSSLVKERRPSSSSLVQEGRVMELTQLLEQERRGREEEKRGWRRRC